MLLGIYAINGALSGKDTLADMIIEDTNKLDKNKEFQKMSFAWPLKEMVCALFGWDIIANEDRSIKDAKVFVQVTDITVHNLKYYMNKYNVLEEYDVNFDTHLPIIMELLGIKVAYDHENRLDGTGFISPREAYQLFGTEYARQVISKDIWLNMVPLDSDVIIPDVRFQNEIDFIRENGKLIHLYRPIENIEDKMSNSEHVSEGLVVTPIEEEDYVDNSGSLKDLSLLAYTIAAKYTKLGWYAKTIKKLDLILGIFKFKRG